MLNTTVGAETSFEFQLQLGRDSGNEIVKNDYLLIDIPPDSTAEWLTTGEPKCEMFNDGAALKCQILG